MGKTPWFSPRLALNLACESGFQKIRCKEIYVTGAYRYRSPDEDLPTDFPAKRHEYYTKLDLPLSADAFITLQKQEMKAALEMFDRGMTKNQKVKFTTRKGKSWIHVAKLERQPEPKNITALKAEVGRRWGQLFLLDVFKEAALRLGLANFFKSPALYETLPRDMLQVRLILCLYALGTNIGLKRIVSGLTEKYRDLVYIRTRYINLLG